MKITHLPDTRIRGGYAVINVKLSECKHQSPQIIGDVCTMFDPSGQTWDTNGFHVRADAFDDGRNLVLTDEHLRLIAEAKGGAHE